MEITAIKVISKTIKNTGKEHKNKDKYHLKAIFKMDKKYEDSIITMDAIIRVNLKTINSMEKDNCKITMEVYTKAHLKMENFMDTDNSNGKMAQFIEEITLMVTDKEMDNFLILKIQVFQKESGVEEY